MTSLKVFFGYKIDEQILNALVEKIEILTPTHLVLVEEQDEGGGN
ncbi:hypothetical protein Desaci_1631 [Desulfosporosinus acidiphilus SJ4]|uniref:Uncharacterized protein n=1 Tax=Desulfosporosinus acidiphilus (strain DSM 22704 / JCM 16185 / SJ4) TaxID=646529 RepID=I4D4A6_DESAJ|nr:hypothetical protein Desaci_1631 [Desulfosporosinus acidiphilus SJ4]